MAMLQIKLVITRIMWLYDFRRADGDIGCAGERRIGAMNGRQEFPEYNLRSHISAACDGPILQFRRKSE